MAAVCPAGPEPMITYIAHISGYDSTGCRGEQTYHFGVHLAALRDRRCVRGGHFRCRWMGNEGELGGGGERNSSEESAEGNSGGPQLDKVRNL